MPQCLIMQYNRIVQSVHLWTCSVIVFYVAAQLFSRLQGFVVLPNISD